MPPMMHSLALAGSLWLLGLVLPAVADREPNLPFDIRSPKDCAYWYDTSNRSNKTCESVRETWEVSPETFSRWNPTISVDCEGWAPHHSYCVAVWPEEGRNDTATAPSPASNPDDISRLVAYWAASYEENDCAGTENNLTAVPYKTNDSCFDTSCNVTRVYISGWGSCPDGEIQIGYWERPGCSGEWYGYDYTERGLCYELWSGGTKFNSVEFRCALKSDCCTADPEPSTKV